MDIEIGNVGNVNIDISSEDIELEAQTQTREVGEATSYEELNNLPQINDVTLIGNVSLNELGIQSKGNYLTSETDPIFSESASAGITSKDITAWNAKADSSAIPTKTSDLTNDGDGTSESKFATESYVNANGGKIDKIKVNGTQQTITNKSVDITVPTNNNQLINGAGYITGIDSTDVTTALGFTPYNSTNPDGYQTSNEVESAINTKISSTYKAKGSVIFANLPSLASSNEGNVYNVSDSFTTTSDFVEGAGKSYPAGTNVVIMNTTGSTYKYDVLSGMVDLSGYQTKIDSSHKLSSDLVDDTNNTKKFVTSSEKSIWNGKQDTIIAGTNISIASDGKTISATDTTYNEATTSTAGLMSSSDKNKLNGIASGAEVNVQSNWNESNSNSDAYIKNKPSIPPEVTETTVANWGFTKNTGDYSKPSGGIPATDLSSAVQTSLSKADSAIQHETYTGTVTGITMNGASKGTSGVVDLGTVITSHQDISGKQNITDNTLNTTNKTIPTAINEINSIAKGANQALSYSNYQTMINTFNSLEQDVYKIGQNVMIVTLEVPDLWISEISQTSSTYTYTSDSAIVTDLQTNGYIKVGYYKLSMLETQKIDLTDYVTNSDYPSGTTAGVIAVSSAYGTNTSPSGYLRASERSYAQYSSDSSYLLIGKGTLENILAGKGLIKKTIISSSSTDSNVVTPKAVYDYIQSLDASEVSY